ncbi:hypothetical protein BKA70DRAFT_786710 [Coprinopsis sp. MPI-PUGE-AT-0042]|nr:hypothetical protein BKA70DRAFT_786710 [Coprinopsis sp. MPI-PUGE-AT-0042]
MQGSVHGRKRASPGARLHVYGCLVTHVWLTGDTCNPSAYKTVATLARESAFQIRSPLFLSSSTSPHRSQPLKRLPQRKQRKMVQLFNTPSLVSLVILTSLWLSAVLASPIQSLDFDGDDQAAFSSPPPAGLHTAHMRPQYACPKHDKAGWILSFLPLSPGSYYPYRRPMSRNRNRDIRVRTNRIDRTVDILGKDVEEQICCLYPINTSDSNSLCFYSRTSGALIEDRNKGNCHPNAMVDAERS